MSDATFPPLHNLAFVDAIYETYRQNPDSVGEEWRSFFDEVPATALGQRTADAGTRLASGLAEKQAGVLQLIAAHRFRGHRLANLDPLTLTERRKLRDLDPAYYGLGEADLDRTFNTGSLFGPAEATLREILSLVQATYCGSVGAEYRYLTSRTQKDWIQERLESAHGEYGFSDEERRNVLKWVTAGAELEAYLHKRYVGQKRFSLEGAESLIPLLDELIQSAGARHGVREIIIGMAHRGRLNVLVNTLGKSPKALFGEFEGIVDEVTSSGDVKYHLGFSSEVSTGDSHVHVVLAFNPSHLEIIAPVVEGSVRARQERRGDRERNQVVPVILHGDAAFAGQGVVMETLNLFATRGYGTGGTVHVVVNNQIGFTTSDPLDSRSTLYCTDVAKMVQAPIFHVNGDDPEAVVFVTRLALDFRMRFNKDVVIDMVCYRRHGHNEADEPQVTQPMMYGKIQDHPRVRDRYAAALVEAGVIGPDEPARMTREYLGRLEAGEVVSRPLVTRHIGRYLADWRPYRDTPWTHPTETAVTLETIERLGQALAAYPPDFPVHRTVAKIMESRREMALGERPMDWGFAENLAYATLLEDGYAIRLSGQDSERGTFFHRHAVIHNQEAPGVYKPLQHLSEGQPKFRVVNSLLSEEAVLAFEYGFSSAEPECLTIWEAQFGDFANGAQVVIDQFLSSSEAKWGRYCGLVMLLPHGYDGQGPEHSSARLERYLQLCAEDNIQVCVPSTPAQMFHLLRRQMVRPYRKPLIVMSPKSLLRHRMSVATREELAEGTFKTLIDEVDALDPNAVTRLVLCCGKVYYDLLEQRRKQQLEHIAIVRVEQLYPFPKADIEAILERYAKAKIVVWAQEEPQNQGAWSHMLSRRNLAGMMKTGRSLKYAGRYYSASPATGHLSVHLAQQRALAEEALALGAVTEIRKQSA